MKKIIIFIGILTLTWGCNDDSLTDLNVDTKNPSSGVPSGALLGNAEKNLFDQMTNTNVNTNVFRLWAQHWSETTYLDESNYDVLQRNVPDSHWQILYRDVLKDLKEATKLTEAEETVTPAELKVKTNKLAIIEVLNVYAYTVLVDTFGNVPYTEALDPDAHPSPAYDDAKVIYADLFKRLDAAIAKLDASAKSFGESDFIYAGDVAHWKKFANSLKLRMAITVADEPTLAATAKTAAEQAVAGGIIASTADNATLQYKSTQPNTNPLYEDLVTSGRYDFVAAAPLVTKMNTLNDPRRPYYYIPVGGVFIGAPYAQGVDFETYSSAGDPADDEGDHTRLLDPTLEGLLIDYTEVEFYLAEAVERGFAVGGTAATHYNNAITSSIVYWGGTTAQAATYLAQPTVAYATATGTWKQKIGEQAWIGFYNRGYEAWTSWRRLDFPVLTAPSSAVPASEGQVPKRFTYPVLEQTLNKTNYAAAGTAVGGDKLKTKLFWDKF
ncbi:SusD/RagB family nutrient-binding outer membrane lipoprotein [Flavobacterium sp. LHD-80]|uniref:SusD/RagB family nutrient-binding outer membrane lipoprotein n=1 Tax=Flavobacterium sp. LHD-80 TaxID=3071411 RepID=UPI0027DF22CA|nr:SusD/RagB family nutrient-binding outer membrane lipoprotein [Flavobacterium sp. LHD-80]MDQ6471991.1 SusD/RagB family nutrient-binding outer membrane lipoprotein [Flavobacterium sp. LHD-80]